VNHPVLLVAKQEFVINRRNKWVAIFALAFTLLTFFVSYFGMVTSGYSGFQDFARTSTSLIKLSGFLIPLFSLLVGVFSFITQPDYLELMISQPLTRSQIIFGKFIGLSLTLLSATIIGFTVPGVIISLSIGTEGALGYLMTVIFLILQGLVFLGCAILIAQITNRQQLAIGIAVGVWIFFEVIYGLIILGTTIYFEAEILKYLLIFSLIGNPIDLTRVLSLIAIGGLEFFGPAGATLYKIAGSQILALAYGIIGLIFWLVLPLLISLKLFSKQDL
jgi:Cu-processing system permease protein